jgi:hypothetical protein
MGVIIARGTVRTSGPVRIHSWALASFEGWVEVAQVVVRFPDVEKKEGCGLLHGLEPGRLIGLEGYILLRTYSHLFESPRRCTHS